MNNIKTTPLSFRCRCGSNSYQLFEVHKVFHQLFVFQGKLNPTGVISDPEPTGEFYIICDVCNHKTKPTKLRWFDDFIEKYKYKLKGKN